MKIKDLFNNKTVYSFEIFPPKKDMPMDTVYETLDGLKGLHPDFISVTCGAGGSGNNNALEVAGAVKNKYGIESVCHMPCIHFTKETVLSMIDSLEKEGVENILALRGDMIEGVKPAEDFHHASDLISFVRENSNMNISGACYPECHTESRDPVLDLKNLKLKVDAGADHLISQLFFDNEKFYTFVERARIAGINVPIEAGIMPVMSKKQIERMVTMCGASLPKKYIATLEKYEHSPEALRDAGIAYAIDQIVDLVSNGVDGVHLYTMNNPDVARRITESTASLFAASSAVKTPGSLFRMN